MAAPAHRPATIALRVVAEDFALRADRASDINMNNRAPGHMTWRPVVWQVHFVVCNRLPAEVIQHQICAVTNLTLPLFVVADDHVGPGNASGGKLHNIR